MPADLAVTTAFDAKGDILKMLKGIDNKVDKFGNSSKRAFRKANKGASSFKATMATMKGILAAGAVSKGINLIGLGVKSVATSFIDLDHAATGAAVRFKDIGPDAKDFKTRLLEIKKVARDAGGATEKSADQMAIALDFLAKAGFNSRDAFAALIPMVNLATATGEDFATVADISSDLMGSFGLSVKDPIQNLKNLNRLNNVLTSTANTANVTVSDMKETMKAIGPIAKGVLGASLEEVAAATGLLGDSALKGGDALTALKNIYLRLAAPVASGAEALKLMDITMKGIGGKPKKLAAVMQEVKDGISGLDKVDRAKVLDAVFGKRAIAGATVILNNLDKLREKEKALAGIEGTTARTADVLRGTVKNRIEVLKSTLTELGLKIISPFENDIKAGITRMTEFFRTVDTKPFTEGIRVVIDKIKELKIDDFKGIGNLFDKISSIDLVNFEKFPERIATGIEGAVKGIDNFLIAFEKMWVKIEPIIDAINEFIGDDGKPSRPDIPDLSSGKMIINGQEIDLSGGKDNTPQKTEAEARRALSQFNQTINVNKAGPETEVETKTTAAPQLAAAGGENIRFNGR